MPCDLPSAQSRSARGHQADSLSGKRLPYSGGQWLCCLWQKGPFLRWVQFLIEQKNSKNFTSGCFESSPPWKLIVLHQQCWSESISAPDILGLYCPLLFWNIFAFFFFFKSFFWLTSCWNVQTICSGPTVLPVQLCLFLFHDTILSTSVFTAAMMMIEGSILSR